MSGRGWHLKCYSIILIMLHNVFVLLNNALILLKSIIASIIYCSGHIGAVISVVHLDPAGSEIICKLGSGSIINSWSDWGFESGSKLSSVSN